jgi:hypothetical protein
VSVLRHLFDNPVTDGPLSQSPVCDLEPNAHRCEAGPNVCLRFLRVKDNVNQSIESLESAIADIKCVVVAQSAEEDLTQTIDNHYDGELAVLKKAINQPIDLRAG